MKPTHIFLDLDDVLNCFTPYVLSQLGCGNDPRSYDSHPREAGWNIVDAANLLNKSRCWTASGFWESITRHHWATVPRSAEFGTLIRLSTEAVGRDNIFILSSPTRDPDSLAGKLEWILANCPPWMHRKFLIGPPKWVCSRPGALLIDDNEDNVHAFREHGGEAILVPRPWNSLDGSSATTHLRRTFSRLLGKGGTV